jgi:ribosomal protein S20
LKTVLRKTLKEIRAKIVEGEAFDLNETYASIDRVSSKGVIPKKRASRLKSRLSKAAAKITAQKD